MKTVSIAALRALMTLMTPLAGAAQAAPPSAAQKAEFYKVCVGISQNVALCTCKADAALRLIDADFMAVVIASMAGRPVEARYYDAYNTYIARSTEACGMGGM
jgi:hypothetical protein